MIQINIICGISTSGKTFFINSQKKPQDIVIDVFPFQQNNKDFLKAEYLFYAQIEDTIRKLQKGTIWIENIFAKAYRRKAVLSFFKNLTEGLNKEVDFKLYYISVSQQRFINNYTKRFPHQQIDGAYYKARLNDIDIPRLNEGWSSVEIVSFE